MKKALYATAGSALALILLAAAIPASADVNVTATITKQKDITITEDITITKTVDITVAAVITPEAAAEAMALMNVSSHDNTVDGQDANPDPNVEPDFNIHLSAVLSDSVNDNIGVWGFNQDVGNMSNQGNVVAVAGVTNLPAFVNAQAEADQVNTGNSSRELEILKDTDGIPIPFADLPGKTPADFLANKEALIEDSINRNQGVINVNQNTGNMNNQSNGVAVAVGLGALVALSESALGQTNSGNHVEEASTVKHGLIGGTDGSINGNSGIVNVNQSNGNMNNQGNVVSLAAITSGAILTSP